MEWLSAIVLVFLYTGCVAQPTEVVLATTTATVTEGTENVMTYTCTLDAVAVVEMSFALAINNAETTNTEDGFDHPMISGFCCTVAVGALVGTVDITLTNDVIIDAPDPEVLVVKIDNPLGLTDNTVAAGATVMIGADAADTKQIRIIPRDAVIKTKESAASTATITLDFVDDNGAPAAIEEDITLTIAQVNQALTTGEMADFTDPGMQLIVAATSTSSTVTVIILDDNVIENIETVDLMLTDPMPAVASITAVGSSPIQIQIADNDRTELIAVQDMTPMGMGRSSKKDATIWAISDETSSTWDVTDSTLGHNLRDCKRKLRTVGADAFRALELTVPRPERNSKARYNEFTFTREQPFVPGTEHVRTVRAYVTPTSNKKNNDAPIETNVKNVLVVYPHKDGCPALKENHCINVTCTSLNRRQLRWSFIPEGGSESDEKVLKKYNGKDRIPINACGMAGLYIVGRSGRRKDGWVDYVRVIQAACPCDQYDASSCKATSIVGGCKNQGVLDQTLDLCTCRPGFGGRNCEIVIEPGVFGQNCQFKVMDYFPKKKTSMKCLRFNFPDTFGSSCAAGFTGDDCCDKCKRGWNFGANCAQTCHCVDSMCDPISGKCTNGCAPGFKGFNCQ